MILFSEDRLLEQAARRIVAVSAPAASISTVMGNRGYDYFRSSLPSIRRSLNGVKFLVFLDGDMLGGRCPVEQIQDWFGDDPSQNLCLRFAIHEVETWLLCDKQNLAAFLAISPNIIPQIDDTKLNTKEILLNCARRSRDRSLRDDLLPANGHTSAIGPAYNLRLTEFIVKHWDIEAARQESSSLDRACKAVAGFI